MLIDSHAHLTMSQFDGDRDEVLARAWETGVRYILTVGAEEQEWLPVIDFARRHEGKGVYASIGVHPHDASSFSDFSGNLLKEYSSDPSVVAIGETGLDYHYMNSSAEIQQDVFRRQIRIAREVGLPIVVHSREAEKETLNILKEEAANEAGGVIHCFSGDLEMAREASAMGFFISFSGSLTFKNAEELRRVAKSLPLDNILIETDAPYLAPQSVRGKRNEPAFVRSVVETLAELKGLSPEDVGRVTSHNALQLFSIGSKGTSGKIAYQIRNSLYLNITNRCTNSCGFCIRKEGIFLKGHNLRISREPSSEEVIRAIGNPRDYREVVFCGYGEPLLRIDLIKEVAAWIKQQGGAVRVNTNGHGNLIHKRNILPELQGLVDDYSVSLNAENEEKYLILCKPVFGAETFGAVKKFIQEAGKVGGVSVTVVNLSDINIEACREIAEKELKAGFRMRYYDDVV